MLLTSLGKRHDSMMTHFRVRYAQQSDQRKAALIALSVLLAINVQSIVNLLLFAGVDVGYVLESRVGAILIFAICFATHGAFVWWRNHTGANVCAETADVPRKLAMIYLIMTLVVFFGSLALSWNPR